MNKYRHAGLLYLIIAIIGPFSILYVPSKIYTDTAVHTWDLLRMYEGLFQAGILIDVLLIMLEVSLISVLYSIFKKINGVVSMQALFLRYSMVVVMIVNVMISLVILYSSSAGDVQFFYQIHEKLTLLWGILFGGHLIALTYLIHKHSETPKYLPYFVGVGAVAYILDGIMMINIQVPFTMILLMVGVVGELWFTFWLLLKKSV